MSRAELERFQTGATAPSSPQEAVGEANGVSVCLCVCGGGWRRIFMVIVLSYPHGNWS